MYTSSYQAMILSSPLIRHLHFAVLAHIFVDPHFLGFWNALPGVAFFQWTGPPLSLCTDGDLLACIDRMVRYRSARSIRVSKVKGHATDLMVAEGKVRREDKDGNDAADVAANFGRLRQPEAVIDARREPATGQKRMVPHYSFPA